MSYWGETWSLVCALLWAIGIILFRIAVRGIPAIEMGLFKNFVALLFFLLTWFIFPELEGEASLTTRDFMILLLSGILGIAVGDTLFLHSLSLLGAGRNAILVCLFSPFVVLLSIIFLDERFSMLQVLGFFLILCGILFAVYQKSAQSISPKDRIRGTLIGICAVFFMATGMVTTKPILTDASPITVSCIRISGGVIGVFLYIIVSGRLYQSIQVFKGRLPWKVMFVGAFIGSYLALFAWIVGFKYTSASIASILNQTSVFFVLVLAVPILNERLTPLKVSGAALGFLGVTLILLNA